MLFAHKKNTYVISHKSCSTLILCWIEVDVVTVFHCFECSVLAVFQICDQSSIMSYFDNAMESLCKFRPARYALAKGNKLSSLIPPPYRDLAADPMPRKILLVHAHPLKKYFTCAVAPSVTDIAIRSGHWIRRVSLYEENWHPLLSAHERKVFGNYKDGLGWFGSA